MRIQLDFGQKFDSSRGLFTHARLPPCPPWCLLGKLSLTDLPQGFQLPWPQLRAYQKSSVCIYVSI